MNRRHKELLNILSKALYTGECSELSEPILRSAFQQDVLPFVSDGKDALSIVINNVKVLQEQDALYSLLNDRLYAVVNGAASAVYYSNPMKKTLRNIEIIAKNPAYIYDTLIVAGYMASCSLEMDVNCIYFMKGSAAIVLHQKMDACIIDAIDKGISRNINNHSFQMLPDSVNGLIILKELSYNPKLASVIDWIMFVERFLDDDYWEIFKPRLDEIGLTNLARVAARFGQIYLNLSTSIKWCQNVIQSKIDEFTDRIFQDDVDIISSKHSRPLIHFIYSNFLKSPLCKPAYYITDLKYVMLQNILGKPDISEEDRINVEQNVTFIFKSFNRQRQAKRLYKSIKSYYPNVRIVIADDSKIPLEINGVIHLPFNSGLSKGLIQALEQVDTPFVMRLDDDMLLTPYTKIHNQLSFLQNHPEVDLVAVQANYRNPQEGAKRFSQMKMNKRLLLPAGTIIEGREVVYKAVNVFLARTDKIKQVGYDPNIHILDHYDFFYRAAGRIVCVQDPHACVMHCHNRFDREYNNYRYNIEMDSIYIKRKHS